MAPPRLGWSRWRIVRMRSLRSQPCFVLWSFRNFPFVTLSSTSYTMFESTFKNFNFNFNNLTAGNTVSSGDVLTGHISFDLTKATRVSSITMTLTGGVRVHWTTGSGKNRRHHNAKLTFFDLKTVLLQHDGAVGGADKLPAGTHVYPFTCQFPHGDFPSTFHGPHGHIAYSLTVGISRPWHMAKTFKTDLNFLNHININQPDLPAPLSGSNRATTYSLWCSSGEVTLAARTEKKAFTPGETVKIFCDLTNSSSRTATLKVKLKQKQTYYTHNQISKSVIFKELSLVTGEPVTAHTSYQHAEIMITIPSSSSLSITNCSLLQVDYLIQVTLHVKPCRDITVLFPIVLCDTPVEVRAPF